MAPDNLPLGYKPKDLQMEHGISFKPINLKSWESPQTLPAPLIGQSV